MKKNTLLFGMLFFIFSAHAQVVLFEQSVDGTGDGFGSGYSNVSSVGIYTAEDFKVGVQSEIHSITFYGFQPAGNAETAITSFSLYIYEDSGGVPVGDPSDPGTGVLEIIELSPTDPAFSMTNSSGARYDITVDIAAAEGAPLSLSPGTYWIVPVPHGDASIFEIDKFWYWYTSGQSHLSDAQFIDPVNAFMQGFTSWTPISDFPGNSVENALAYAIMGKSLAIEDARPLAEIKLYPNPVANKLYIDIPISLKLESAVMFDLLGNKIPVKIEGNEFMDLSKIASGMYILQLETSQGVLTKKIIKQ